MKKKLKNEIWQLNKEKINFLLKFNFLQSCKNQIEYFCNIFEEKQYNFNEEIYNINELPEFLYLIRSGQVEIVKYYDNINKKN